MNGIKKTIQFKSMRRLKPLISRKLFQIATKNNLDFRKKYSMVTAHGNKL